MHIFRFNFQNLSKLILKKIRLNIQNNNKKYNYKKKVRFHFIQKKRGSILVADPAVLDC